MTFWLTLAGSVAVTYGSRLAGLLLRHDPSPFWTRVLHFVPVAVFAALVTPSLAGSQGEGEIRVLTALAAGVVAWRTRNLAVSLAVGLALFWLLRVPS